MALLKMHKPFPSTINREGFSVIHEPKESDSLRRIAIDHSAAMVLGSPYCRIRVLDYLAQDFRAFLGEDHFFVNNRNRPRCAKTAK